MPLVGMGSTGDCIYSRTTEGAGSHSGTLLLVPLPLSPSQQYGTVKPPPTPHQLRTNVPTYRIRPLPVGLSPIPPYPTIDIREPPFIRGSFPFYPTTRAKRTVHGEIVGLGLSRAVSRFVFCDFYLGGLPCVSFLGYRSSLELYSNCRILADRYPTFLMKSRCLLSFARGPEAEVFVLAPSQTSTHTG